MAVKVSIGFLTTDNDDDLIVHVGSLITCSTGNPLFIDPNPVLAIIVAAHDDFKNSVTAAAKGGTDRTADKLAKRVVLVSLVRQFALYVQRVSAGNLVTLLSSGFKNQKIGRTPAGPMPIPPNITLTLGDHSGELKAACGKVAYSMLFHWVIATTAAPGTPVQTGESAATHFTFKGLTPGVEHQLSVCVSGRKGPGDWSDAVTQIVV